MKALKIAFLWHQHQPNYKMNNEFLMPWTRLHGVKDYYDLPEVLYEFPNIKQTFNIVPSLNLQIEEYISGNVIDRVQYLTALNSNELTQVNKHEILEYFFLCNKPNLIFKHPRFLELFEKAKDAESALNDFTNQDWLDLQVWYNLTWFGYFSKEHKLIKRLLHKGKNFTEDEKNLMMIQQIEVLKRINSQLFSLMKLGQIEICCSPKYHPILPLLINSESALEALPECKLPNPLYKFPQDAIEQIKFGLDYTEEIFEKRPNGMWPSEGSISNETINMFINQNVKWIATDEQVLSESRKDHFMPTEKFFPRKYRNENGEITIFFRDHYLSDRIAFVYSTWNPVDAANDFCNHLQSIKNEIVRVHGEKALDSAVISIMLDGENCWEYYQDNGIPFLKELYMKLSNHYEFQTVTCAEACDLPTPSFLQPLKSIRAGSWINANFAIWIGDDEDRTAWNLLAKARNEVEKNKHKLNAVQLAEVMEEVYIAEGSDWCWWYGPEHNADNIHQFDELFRWHIKRIYEIMDLEIPSEVYIPINKISQNELVVKPINDIDLYEDINNELKWESTGLIDLKSYMSAMHQIGEIVENFNYGKFDNSLFFKFNLNKDFGLNDKIILRFMSPFEIKFNIKLNKFEIDKNDRTSILSYYVSIINNKLFVALKLENQIDYIQNPIDLKLITICDGNEINYPLQGNIRLKF